MRQLLSILAVVLVPVLVPGAAAADEPADDWAALARPGTVAIMRHAIAPGTGDPADFRLGDCTTQRNLDDRGRAQARAIGAAIRGAGIVIDRVLTSQWCRARETAELLGLGEVEDMPALNSFFRDRAMRDSQTRAVRAFLADLPADETVMLVTHQVNITALTGRGVSSGEVLVLQPGPDGSVEVINAVLLRPRAQP